MTSLAQDKQKEIKFFDAHAAEASYDVFTPQSNERLIDAIVRLGKFGRGSRVADLGCGSGVFTDLLQQRGVPCCRPRYQSEADRDWSAKFSQCRIP